jgi:hypothetical protein
LEEGMASGAPAPRAFPGGEGVASGKESPHAPRARLPSLEVMSADSLGLQKASQRRGVTPLVLFWNFSGNSLKKSWGRGGGGEGGAC